MSSRIALWFKRLPCKCFRYHLDFAIFRTLAKIFETFSQDIIYECRMIFNIPVAADILIVQKADVTQLQKIILCKLFVQNADREMNALRQL